MASLVVVDTVDNYKVFSSQFPVFAYSGSAMNQSQLYFISFFSLQNYDVTAVHVRGRTS